MKINRDNYQIWITDHFDGSLNGDQEEMLFLFLDQNPDLKEEFDLYGYPAVFPDISLRINKESLKKDISLLTDDQKEHLLISLTEGDLSDDSCSEITEYIENDPLLSEKLYTLKNIRLIAPDVNYQYKSRLKRIPIGNTTRKIVIRGLSIAATVTILISFWFFIPYINRPEIEESALAYTLPEQPEIETEKITIDLSASVHLSEISPVAISTQQVNNSIITEVSPAVSNPQQNEIEEIARESISITPARITDAIGLWQSNSTYLLAEMTPIEVIEPLRPSSPREFIAKNIRELLLKDVNPGTDRLKGYEVADVTLISVNKVLGWDMRLDRETDGEGNINNLKFTSQLIKFDHKIKNVAGEL